MWVEDYCIYHGWFRKESGRCGAVGEKLTDVIANKQYYLYNEETAASKYMCPWFWHQECDVGSPRDRNNGM